MIDFETKRAKLLTKVHKVRSERHQVQLLPDAHVHEWKETKEYLMVDNDHYTRGTAYFTVNTCDVCKKVNYIDFKVEKY